MNKIMRVLMLSCKQASELIDKKAVVKLSLRENFMLKMHASVCDVCSRYQEQSKLLDTFLEKHIQSKDETDVPAITNDELKRKVISKLN